MFRDNKAALAIVLGLYLICGTLDFADQVLLEEAVGNQTLKPIIAAGA